MEAEKVKEKRGEQTIFSASLAIGLTTFSFFCLSVMTSHRSIGVLPEAQFFYTGGIATAMLLLASPFIAINSRKLASLIASIVILLSLAIILMPIVYMLIFFGTTLMHAWFYYPLRGLPVAIFPLIFLLSIILYPFSRQVSEKISLPILRLISFCSLCFAAFYIWGQAATFEGAYHDESIIIEDKTYHLIISYGWLDSYNNASLYECHSGYFFCQQIYLSNSFDYAYPDADSTSLLYDVNSKILRLEYISEFDETLVSIMYEHPIP